MFQGDAEALVQPPADRPGLLRRPLHPDHLQLSGQPLRLRVLRQRDEGQVPQVVVRGQATLSAKKSKRHFADRQSLKVPPVTETR